MKFIILLINLLIVSAYNIDTNYPILYPNSATNADQYLQTKFERSYFGYSVLLHRDSQKNISWLLVGAPRGNYTRSAFKLLNEPGVVYRCSLPGPCEEIKLTFIGDEKLYISQLDMLAYIKKEHSWFGGAMSIEKNSGFLTVCAPRTILRIMLNSKKYVETLQGMCYSGETSSTLLKPEISEIKSFDFSKGTWFNPIHGFSVTFAPPQALYETISRIVGRPNDNVIGSVYIGYFRKHAFNEFGRKITEIPIHDNLSHLGYAVTSGYYFNRNQSLYACADPGWNHVGQVVIVDLNGNFIPLVTNLHGSDIGEYFGASLASGDLNNDGLHDLVIGAPHWGNDNGRIHVYLGSPREEFEAATILKGTKEDAQFGYAVAIGDVNGDGFSDIIVGAPWEDSGVIYIYNGDASLKDKVSPTLSQRITMKFLNSNLPAKGVGIQAFGFSISEPIDIDNNGYADIAVGAYKSGHVVVFRSKPIVRTNLTVYTVPNTLQRYIRSFLIEACVEYHSNDTTNIHAFKVSFIVDEKYKRTTETSLEVYSTDAPVHPCVNTTITLSDNIQDFIEPITIYASHDFTRNDSFASEFCKTCPVESRNGRSKSAQILLPFDIECGDDRVCNSSIYATVKLWGVRENNTWIIGSNDITLETRLRNYAEPAYLTTIAFTLPKEIVLRSILPFCEEDTDRDTLMVFCNVGNPLGTDEQKVVKLDLDMRHLTNGSLHGQVLKFSTEIRTRSTNHGTNMIKSSLTLQSEASLLLNGKAIEKSYYLSNLDSDRENIIFQHIYQILKFGATPIEEARLVVSLPTVIDDSESLVSLYKPRVYISGKYYDCLSNGVDLVDIQQGELPLETASDTSDLYNLNYNNETLQNATHDVFKRDVDNQIAFGVNILKTLYNITMARSEDSKIGNLTARNIVYVNCSTYGVNCSTISCNLNALRTQQDIGKLAMRLILNVTRLKDNLKLSNEMKIVKFSTDAYVQIIKPAETDENRIFGIDVRYDSNVTTEFHSTAKMQKLQLWVVFVSVTLGLILLFIVVIILNMIGFFKRMTKEELVALKSDKMTEDAEKSTSE